MGDNNSHFEILFITFLILTLLTFSQIKSAWGKVSEISIRQRFYSKIIPLFVVPSSRQKRDQKIGAILVMMVVVFITCNLPRVVINLYEVNAVMLCKKRFRNTLIINTNWFFLSFPLFSGCPAGNTSRHWPDTLAPLV